MNEVIASDTFTWILGNGVTAQAVASFCRSQQLDYLLVEEAVGAVTDSTLSLVGVDDALRRLSSLTDAQVKQRLVVSPGVPPKSLFLQAARAQQIEVVTDLDLLFDYLRAEQVLDRIQTVAVTGTNGKTTVTQWLHALLSDVVSAGKAFLAGNNEVPAIAVAQGLVDATRGRSEPVYLVLELSSFQLFHCAQPPEFNVAAILNIRPDHLEWHADFVDYHRCKHRVYQQSANIVYNRSCDLTQPLLGEGQQLWSFGSDAPRFGENNDLGCVGDELFLGHQSLAMALNSEANPADSENFLAVVVVAKALGCTNDSIQQARADFSVDAHRCQTIHVQSCKERSIRWIDNAKATNFAATISALTWLKQSRVILIVGGNIKGQNPADLLRDIQATNIVLQAVIEVESKHFQGCCHSEAKYIWAESMAGAVEQSARQAQMSDDNVDIMFSPCAASEGGLTYKDRGYEFARCIKSVVSVGNA